MSEKIQFQTNIPVEVALKYNDGKEVTGQYGDQVLYTLTDGRVMYVPPIVKKRIDELGIARGELFTITKAEKKNGTRRMIEWMIATKANEQGHSEIDSARRKEPNSHSPGCTNGNGHKPAPPKEPQGFLLTNQGQLLVQAFAAAVDVAAATERYAANCGMELQFTSEDLRNIGLSIYRSA
jgi:hypothetical protein